MTEVLKAGKKVELNGLIKRKNKEKCKLEFHINIDLCSYCVICSHLTFYDSYKILKLIEKASLLKG